MTRFSRLSFALTMGAVVLLVFGGALILVVLYSGIDSHVRAGIAGGLVSALSAYLSIIGSIAHNLLSHRERE